MNTNLLGVLLTASAAIAQTTGVPGLNDLTVNLLGSGSTSCSPFCFPGGNVTINLDLSAPAGSSAFLLLSFCRCLPCQLTGPTNSCLPPIPLTACGGSNQSLDLDMSLPCGIAAVVPFALTTAGTLSLQVPIPPIVGFPCSTALSVQAVVIDTCGLGLFAMPGPFVLSQSYSLLF